ncbi:isoprenylcysteine carboxylmethyltransferase family protein [uncultured Metabacillus sp.]|uniref:isoprenylcysteine carboxyl methyltransferase family protein n=1 Tax=Metabacillus sp. Hm71 TaxID=3450743 RepID=UPI00260DCDE3|nr:isoprenylcysteine carboxylmethyltransferase family protein [uncultured Metabacillus sp.]
MMFIILFSLLLLQRVVEMVIAKRNEKWMLKQGGIEHGSEHYPYIIALHILFFISLFLEVTIFEKEVTSIWYILVPIIAFTQIIRYWAIYSLGSFWNTKIIILPNVHVVLKGPYKYLKHPNYVVVAVEILFIPLLFQAYMTAILFSLLNLAIMSVRIPTEEKALEKNTNYEKAFQLKTRFIPKK